MLPLPLQLRFLGLGLFELLIGLILLWLLVSIPVYFAGKAVVGGKASFGAAMLATLVGPIIFVIVLFLGSLVTLPVGSNVLAYLLAFLAWIWVYKSAFNTGWVQGFGIALLSILLAIVLGAILALLGLAVIRLL